MYTEFIAIYIGLGVLAALMVVVMILLIKLLRQLEVRPSTRSYTPAPISTGSRPSSAPAPAGNVVFCKRCAAEFDASQKVCPNCGTPR